MCNAAENESGQNQYWPFSSMGSQHFQEAYWCAGEHLTQQGHNLPRLSTKCFTGNRMWLESVPIEILIHISSVMLKH